VSGKSERALRLRQSAAEKTRDQISQWDSLFRDSSPKETYTTTSTLDPNASDNQTELKSGLADAKRNAYSRLREALEEIHTQELQKSKYEDEQGTWETWFRSAQVIGLIMVVISGVLDAWGKQKETQ
jgi:hypothetical protein